MANRKGLWHAELKGCEASHGMPIVCAANGHLVATLASRDAKKAHLLAAAPAMLAELKRQLAFLARKRYLSSYECEEVEILQALVRTAEGEANA